MRRARVEIDLAQLRRNVRAVRAALGEKSELILVVKSEAYGHGMLPVALAAAEEGVGWFAVAHLSSALRLRARLNDVRILLLGVLDADDVAEAVSARILPLIVSRKHGLALGAAARDGGVVLPCHIKVDTGMGRLGFEWGSAAAEIAAVRDAGGIEIRGLCTHFAAASGPGGVGAAEQTQRLGRVLRDALERGLPFPFVHTSNSAGFQRDEAWDRDGVRLGILMYGYGQDSSSARARTAPFLQWKADVVMVKDVGADFPVSYDSTYRTATPTRLATVNVGYGDGYPRLLSNRGQVLIRGRRCPVAGRITMNLTVVDVGRDSGVEVGDEVVLLGRQQDESIWADEIADLCGTIPYEILTGICANRRGC